MNNQLAELNRKYRKLTFRLGELIYRSYQEKSIRFLYTSDGEDEKDINKTLRLLDYMEERIARFSQIQEKMQNDGKDENNENEENKVEDRHIFNTIESRIVNFKYPSSKLIKEVQE